MNKNPTFTDNRKDDCERNVGFFMEKNRPEKIILGCTHYPYLTDILSKFVPSDMFIDPAICFAKYIVEDLKNNDMLSDNVNGYEKFYVSSNPKKFLDSANNFYPILSLPELV